MNKENGKGMIKALILLVIILCLIGIIIKSINSNINNQKTNSVMSNMLTIKSACKVFNENRLRTKSEEALIGTKISEIKSKEENKENEEEEQKDEEKQDEDTKVEINVNESLIEEFKKLQVINEDEYSKYYVLTNENLEELKLDVTNEKDSYYLINYETNEVIFTKGYEGKYKLSDIEKIQEEENIENSTEDDTKVEDEEDKKETAE